MFETPKIVATVTGTTMAELCAARDRATTTGADIVELRLDGVSDIDVSAALSGRALPVIVTCRPVWEGGRFDGAEGERLRILADALRQGAEYVDVEWKADRRSLPSDRPSAIVLSHHDHAQTPADLPQRVRAMRADHAGIVKISTMARRLSDVVRLHDAVRDLGPRVAIAMGSAGQVSRIWPAGFGSAWTYGGTAAPGQLDPQLLVNRYHVRETRPTTRVYGLIGSPVEHSASPAMHNAAFAALGIDAVYGTFDTSDANDFWTLADGLRIAGASVTAPLKRDMRARLDRVDDTVERVGVVNTLRCGSSGWEGRNFDIAGFLDPLRPHAESLRGQHAVVLGAGGAARAAVFGLQSIGARVAISARRSVAAASLATEFGVESIEWPPQPGWHVLVNTTPVGTWPRVSQSPLERDLVRGPLVYDLVYNPVETQLMTWARAAGGEAIGGLSMLVAQAAAQFEWWTGQPAPVDVMRKAAEEFLL